MYEHELFEKQIAIEAQALDYTRQMFWKNVGKAASRNETGATSQAQFLIKRFVDEVEAALQDYLAVSASGKAGPKRVAAKLLRDTPTDIVSYIALKTLFDYASMANTELPTLALELGTRIEDQLRLEKFRKLKPDLFRLTETRLDNSGVAQRRRRKNVMRIMANRNNVAWDKWPQDDRVQVGTAMVDMMITVGIAVKDKLSRRTGRKYTTHNMIRLSEGVQDSMERIGAVMELSQPRYVPTIIPPKRWTTPFNGGYWSGLAKDLTIVKTRKKNLLEEFAANRSTDVMNAINRVQETPWRVNTWVLGVMLEAIDKDRSVGKLPYRDSVECPAKPVDIETNEEARKEWRRKASLWHDQDRKVKSRRKQVYDTVAIAKEFQAYDRIYFPHQFDFRGRLYATPLHLNPQGADFTKSLLTFANGKPIEDGTAAGWLAIHGANCFGEDKVSLEDRIDWVEQHADEIIRTANDPWEDSSFWENADKPWQFLAFCREWAEFLTVGYGYVSHLPVALDGSCNGLQHYSAALRDPKGGAATNLIPSEQVADIYAEVAKVATERVSALVKDTASDPGSEAWFAAKWLEFGIDRKTTKRAVMTLPYGSTQFSCREFIEEAMRDRIEGGQENPFPYLKKVTRKLEDDSEVEEFVEVDGVFDASLFLKEYVWKAIGDVVVAARAAMDWLKVCARLSAKEGLPVNWTTPDGFFVLQDLRKQKARRIKTHLDGSMVRLSLATDAPDMDAQRMANSIAPNFVHSLDATALRMYVNLAADNGLTHFGVVHDSFSTVAGDVDVMVACIKEAFASMYEDFDPLEDFRREIEAMLSEENREKLTDVPPKGALEISRVRESDFFFA